MKISKLASFVALSVFAATAVAACGGAPPGPNTLSGSSRDEYQEYTCPDPIGKIVREDCSKSALQYQGESFEGSVNAVGVGASASYKQSAIREADSLVQMLKEQRVSLCNNFNTCKLTVVEYREDQKALDNSFVALAALKDKMSNVDAEGATKLLEEIRAMRNNVQAKAPEAAKPSAPMTGVAASVGAAPPASAGYTCKGPSLLLFQRGMIAGPNFGYDKTREAMKGHPELGAVEFVEFILESDTLTGGKQQQYVLVGVAPDLSTADKLRTVVKTINPGAGQDIGCPAKPPARKLDFNVK